MTLVYLNLYPPCPARPRIARRRAGSRRHRHQTSVSDPNRGAAATTPTYLVAFDPATGGPPASPWPSGKLLARHSGSLACAAPRARSAFILIGNLVALSQAVARGRAATGSRWRRASCRRTATPRSRPAEPGRRCRSIAHEFTADAAKITLLEAVAVPPIADTTTSSTAGDKAAHLGLGVADDGEHAATVPTR